MHNVFIYSFNQVNNFLFSLFPYFICLHFTKNKVKESNKHRVKKGQWQKKKNQGA